MALSDTSLTPLLFLISLRSFAFLSLSLSPMMSFPFVWDGQKWCHHLKQEPEARTEAFSSVDESVCIVMNGSPRGITSVVCRGEETELLNRGGESLPAPPLFSAYFKLLFYPLFTLMVPLLIPSLSSSLKQAISSLSISSSPSVTFSSRCLRPPSWLRGQAPLIADFISDDWYEAVRCASVWMSLDVVPHLPPQHPPQIYYLTLQQTPPFSIHSPLPPPTPPWCIWGQQWQQRFNTWGNECV